MSVWQFLMVWLAAGMITVATRRTMIYAESNPAYRFTLLIVCAVFGLVVNVGSGVWAGLRNFRTFWSDTMAGINPQGESEAME